MLEFYTRNAMESFMGRMIFHEQRPESSIWCDRKAMSGRMVRQRGKGWLHTELYTESSMDIDYDIDRAIENIDAIEG